MNKNQSFNKTIITVFKRKNRKCCYQKKTMPNRQMLEKIIRLREKIYLFR